jgi:hypothetical protein
MRIVFFQFNRTPQSQITDYGSSNCNSTLEAWKS